jgi:hypothetical protein
LKSEVFSMVSSSAPVSGLSALDQLVLQFINAKPTPQSTAIPVDTVTLSTAAAIQRPVTAPEVTAVSKAG